ncbi:MAG TPA: SIMPL domain-containing protein [Patescibacteria group bacterium]|nr:SIMPL domain-containing protein [Patescibacteria group bacterium]
MDPAQQSSSGFTANYSSNDPKMPMDLKKFLMVILSILALLVIWTYVNSPLVVTVTGSGEASVPATNATISFTISASDSSITGAVSGVTAKADQMRQYLISKGVAEGSIAQSQVTEVPAALISQGAQGYQATVSMAAKTTHVSDVNTLVADLYSNGALVVSQPVLSIENQNTVDQQVFNSALGDAKKQASAIGFANWKFIRKIVSITQVSSPITSTSTTKADAVTIAANTSAATNGVFKIVKAVSVSYKMW